MVTVLPDEARQPSVVIAVGVAQYQAINLGGVDIEEMEVPVDDLGRVAEIEHVLGPRASSLRGEMKRQAPLTCQRRHLAARNPLEVFDGNMAVFLIGREQVISRVDHDPDTQPIDRWSGKRSLGGKRLRHEEHLFSPALPIVECRMHPGKTRNNSAKSSRNATC